MPSKKVSMFSQNILNITSNFIFHETVAYNGRDSPWITKEIKNLIDQKHFDHHDENSHFLDQLQHS